MTVVVGVGARIVAARLAGHADDVRVVARHRIVVAGTHVDQVHRARTRVRAQGRSEQVVALGRTRHLVEDVDTRTRSRIEQIVGCASRVFAVSAGQFVLTVIVEARLDVAAVEGRAPAEVVALNVAAAIEGAVDEGRSLKAVQVRAGDDVHNAGDGVRTIDRRSTVLQDFDALDHGLRDDVQVDGLNLAARTSRADATAVQQDQGPLGTQAAQRHRVDAAAAFGHEAGQLVVQLIGARGDRRLLEQFGGIDHAFQGRLFAGDHLNGRGRREFVTTQARTGDDNVLYLFTFFIFILVGRLLLSERRCRHRQSGDEGGRQQKLLVERHRELPPGRRLKFTDMRNVRPGRLLPNRGEPNKFRT